MDETGLRVFNESAIRQNSQCVFSAYRGFQQVVDQSSGYDVGHLGLPLEWLSGGTRESLVVLLDFFKEGLKMLLGSGQYQSWVCCYLP